MNCTLRIAIIFILGLLLNCNRTPHLLGAGGKSPEETIDRFLQSYVNKDYLSIRRLVYYDRSCLGFMGIAVDPLDPEGVETYLDDHKDMIEDPDTIIAMIEKDADADLNLIARDIILNQGCLTKLDSNTYSYTYPTFKVDDAHQVIGTDKTFMNTITLVAIKGRWYIFNPQCTAFACSKQ